MSDESLPPLYAAVVAASTRMAKVDGDQVSYSDLGVAAWLELAANDRHTELPNVLGTYAQRVLEEERELRMTRAAEDRTHTYLGDFDESCLWDSVLGGSRVAEVPADRQALINVLCELELLRHRLAMRDSEK